MTERKRTEWQEKIYLLQNDLGIGAQEGAFCCEYFDDCDRSVGHGISKGRKGDWAYVGSQYGEASVGGKPARVLFVGMDRSFLNREGECHFLEYWPTQDDWRCSALKPRRRNWHMIGVNRTLRLLIDDGVVAEDRCEQFALVNAVFCGPLAEQRKKDKEGKKDSIVSGVMKTNCQRHLQTILLALEPDIVIAQGKGHPQRVCMPFVSNRVEHVPGLVKTDVRQGEVGGKPAWFVVTGHPAARQYLYPPVWDRVDMPPELTAAVELVRDRFSRGGEVGS